jgi:hypothetical protein
MWPLAKIEFRHRENFSQALSQLIFNNDVDATVDCNIQTTFRKLYTASNLLSKACVLLSIAGCNWITPLYLDIYKDDKLVKTTFYTNAKTYSFTHGRTILDLENKIGECYQTRESTIDSMITQYNKKPPTRLPCSVLFYKGSVE